MKHSDGLFVAFESEGRESCQDAPPHVPVPLRPSECGGERLGRVFRLLVIERGGERESNADTNTTTMCGGPPREQKVIQLEAPGPSKDLNRE